MTADRDSMVITPDLEGGSGGPRRRAQQARKRTRAEKEKKGLLSRLREARAARKLQAARAVRKPPSAGGSAGMRSRVAGGLGVAFLFMEAVNIAGRTARRGELGVSGRLLDAMDNHTRFGLVDEQVTGIANARAGIEGNEDLLRIVGIQGRVNAQIADVFDIIKERETARAIGADVIEREMGFDSMDTLMDKAIQASAREIKDGADRLVNALRRWQGKGELVR